MSNFSRKEKDTAAKNGVKTKVPGVNPFMSVKKEVKVQDKDKEEVKNIKAEEDNSQNFDDIEEEDEEDIDEEEGDDDEDEGDDDDGEDEGDDDDDEDEDEEDEDGDEAPNSSLVFTEMLDTVLSRHFEYSQEENTLSMAEIMLLIKQSIDAQTAVLSELLRLKISKYGGSASSTRTSTSSKEKETPEERAIRKQREAASRR